MNACGACASCFWNSDDALRQTVSRSIGVLPGTVIFMGVFERFRTAEKKVVAFLAFNSQPTLDGLTNVTAAGSTPSYSASCRGSLHAGRRLEYGLLVKLNGQEQRHFCKQCAWPVSHSSQEVA